MFNSFAINIPCSKFSLYRYTYIYIPVYNRACKSRARKRGWGQLGAESPYSPC